MGGSTVASTERDRPTATPSATPTSPPSSSPWVTRMPETRSASASAPLRISSRPASAISDGAGNTSAGMAPTALPNCQIAAAQQVRRTGPARRCGTSATRNGSAIRPRREPRRRRSTRHDGRQAGRRRKVLIPGDVKPRRALSRRAWCQPKLPVTRDATTGLPLMVDRKVPRCSCAACCRIRLLRT